MVFVAPAALGAQGRGGGAPQQPPPPPPFDGAQGAPSGSRGAQARAPIDLTGYWVAVITEDWRWRMVTPAKGDVASIPLTQAALDVANRWDPEEDEAAGLQCKAYGAPGLMRAPTRLHMTWEDEDTLKVETDYGMQTRRLHFPPGRPDGGPPSWQGDSIAQWEAPAAGRGRPSTNAQGAPSVVEGRGGSPASGNLKVVTTNLRPGYLRKNGVPYSADTMLTEYWDVFEGPGRNRWLVVTTVVHDPENLQIDWMTSLNFKQEADGAGWDPTPCSTTW
ncbi:MAG: hypothetical protein HY657_06130 [Acidobacteria bacterium]|nr:hypothetical protein [Acidobacteriota bacterium]